MVRSLGGSDLSCLPLSEESHGLYLGGLTCELHDFWLTRSHEDVVGLLFGEQCWCHENVLLPLLSEVCKCRFGSSTILIHRGDPGESGHRVLMAYIHFGIFRELFSSVHG